MKVTPLATSEIEPAGETCGGLDLEGATRATGTAREVAKIVFERLHCTAELLPKLFEAARTLLDQKRDFLTSRESLHLAPEMTSSSRSGFAVNQTVRTLPYLKQG
jgi:hypothetical protein